MKGNIVVELRKVVKTLYLEGYKEIFSMSIIDSDKGVLVQAADFDLNFVDVPMSFIRTYDQATKVMMLAKSRYGNECKAVSTLICDEVKESVYMDGNVLRVMNLNL